MYFLNCAKILFGHKRSNVFFSALTSVDALFLLWRIFMKCSNYLCVFWDRHKCSLESIEINEAGMCSEYIPVVIDEEYLEEKRHDFIDSLEFKEDF